MALFCLFQILVRISWQSSHLCWFRSCSAHWLNFLENLQTFLTSIFSRLLISNTFIGPFSLIIVLSSVGVTTELIILIRFFMIAFSNYQVLSQQEVFFPNSGRRRRSITWIAPLTDNYFKTWTYNEVWCKNNAINLAFDDNQIFILNVLFVNTARQYWSGHTYGLRALRVRCRLHIAFNATYESLNVTSHRY